MIKTGANYSDRVMIKELADNGKSAKQIADFLQLPESCVESFMDGGTEISVTPPDSTPKIPPLPKMET